MSFSKKESMAWQKIKAGIALANAYQTLITMKNSNPHCTFGGVFLMRNCFIRPGAGAAAALRVSCSI